MTNWIEKMYWTAFTAWHGRGEKKFPYLPKKSIRHRQNLRVKAIVEHAYRTVPFYKEAMTREGLTPADFRTARDLEKLPLIAGKDFSENPERFYSSAVDRQKALMLDTTGSTGHYKRIYHDKSALFLARAGGQRNRHVLSAYIDRSLGYKEVSIQRDRGTGPVIIDFYQSHSYAPKGIRLDRHMSSPEDTFEQNIEVINRIKPDVVIGFGSYVGAVFRKAWVAGIPVYPPKVVVYGGDALQDPDRQIIQEEFRTPILSSYQCCEALNIAFQCEHAAGFHVSLDQVALRIADPHGTTLAPGNKGEIVISNLINRATVLLNYRTGDVGKISATACPCGRTLPTLESLDGRTDDVIVLPDGEVVHESVILPKLYGVPGVLQAQVIQETLSQYVIKVVGTPDADGTRLEKGLREALAKAVGEVPGTAVTIEQVTEIQPREGGKFKSIISDISNG